MNPPNIDVSAMSSPPAWHEAPPATYVLLHSQPRLSLVTDSLLLPPEQAPAFDDAMALADALSRLHAEEAARIRSAVEAGHAQGHAEGLAQGRREAQHQATAQLAATTQRLTERAEAEARALEQQLVPLAVMVVRRIAAGLAPETVLGALARQALGHLASGRATVGTEAPDTTWAGCQLRLPAALLPQMETAMADIPGLRLVADDGLGELDCVLDTPAGRLLAGLETQLGRVQARLMQAEPGPTERGHAATTP